LAGDTAAEDRRAIFPGQNSRAWTSGLAFTDKDMKPACIGPRGHHAGAGWWGQQFQLRQTIAKENYHVYE